MGDLGAGWAIRPTLRERERERERGCRMMGEPEAATDAGPAGTPTDCIMVNRSFNEIRVELFTSTLFDMFDVCEPRASSAGCERFL